MELEVCPIALKPGLFLEVWPAGGPWFKTVVKFSMDFFDSGAMGAPTTRFMNSESESEEVEWSVVWEENFVMVEEKG